MKYYMCNKDSAIILRYPSDKYEVYKITSGEWLTFGEGIKATGTWNMDWITDKIVVEITEEEAFLEMI